MATRREFLRNTAILAGVILISFLSINRALGLTVPGGKIYSITITNPAFKFDRAKYSIFIPDSVASIRAIFVHQHGCTMEGTGYPTAYDVQYQEFAKKWHLAILGPDIYPKTGGDCHQWIDPENGSSSALFAALDSFGQSTGQAELKTAPLLLWGHSGGGYWALDMLREFPERILAVVSYSAAFAPNWSFPTQAAKVPVLLRHAGSGDINAEWAKVWLTAVQTFNTLRKMDGYASIAHNLNQTHNFSYIRYMTIPFFDAVLSQRLPLEGSSILRDMDNSKAWLGDTLTNKIYKLSTYAEKNTSMSWLPDSLCAEKWREFVTTGTVKDTTPPSAPNSVVIIDDGATYQRIQWKSDVDYESGIKYFKILKNNITYQTINYQTFNTNGDNCSPTTLPKLEYRIKRISGDESDTFSIIAVNNFELKSNPSTVIQKPTLFSSIKDNNSFSTEYELIEVYSITGILMAQCNGFSKIKNPQEFKPGLYIVRYVNKEQDFTRKIVLLSQQDINQVIINYNPQNNK